MGNSSESRNETSSPRRLSGDRLTEVIAWADTNASAFSKFPHSEKSPADSYLWMLCLAVLDLRDDVQEALRSTRSERGKDPDNVGDSDRWEDPRDISGGATDCTPSATASISVQRDIEFVALSSTSTRMKP